jgi:acyl-CoA thioesterase
VLSPTAASRSVSVSRSAASIEYVVHLATGEPSAPPGEYVYLSCRSPRANEGFAVEDATMWAPDGSVLAVARQTRLAGA